jgi:hypothetical protein
MEGSMKKHFWMMGAGCAVLLLSGLATMAQTITGSVRGTVTDPSGAVVTGAKVTATNVATGIATSTTTDKSGLYNVQFLPIGQYTITATATGFDTTSIGPFRLQIDQIAKIDVKLQVGKAATTVKVTASSSPILNAENSTLGTTISSNTLQNMPMNGQNVNFASMFVPGAVDPTAAAMGGQMGTERDTGIVGGQGAEATPSFSGNRQQANNYVLDGVEINETLNNLIGYNPSPYSIQEMRVITGNADAEYGNVAGGEIVMVTKSGTNQFHGNAWEYFENDGLTANTWAQNHAHAKKQSFTQNQYGGAVGGPLFRNKLFFFGDYSGTYHSIPPSQQVDSVPDAKMRAGDFSEVLAVEGVQLYNNSNGTTNATPYVNNQNVPINNPVAKYLFNTSNPGSLPMPNNAANVYPGTVTSGNYIGTTSSHQANNQGDIRIDYTINSKDSLMGKYTMGDAYDATTQNALPTNFPLGDDYPFKSAMLNWVHTFSSALVNEARGGYSRVIWRQSIPSDPSGAYGNKGDKVVGVGFPFQSQPVAGFTYMAIGGIANCSNTDDWSCNLGTTTNADNYLNDLNFDFGDNLTWVHGNQIIKFGAQFVQYQQNFLTLSNLGGPLGAFGYNGNYTAGPSGSWPFADFVTDQSNQGQIAGVTSPFSQRQWRDAYYVQDDWKVLPNLTFNLGLRYAFDQPIYEVNDRMSSINLPKAAFAPFSDYAINTSPGAYPSWFELAGKNGNSRALYNAVYNEFMPRFGFALQINPRTVLRGGYGITDELEGTGTGLRMTQNPPFQVAFNQTAQAPSATSGGVPFNVATGFASVAGGGNQNAAIKQGSQFDVWAPNFRPALIQQFNLTTQFMINNQTSVSVGYVGEIGQHLAVPMGVNQYTNLPPAPVNGGTACPNGAPLGPNGGCNYLVDPYDSVVGPYGFIIDTESNGIENYNGMQVVLQRQQTNGLEYQLNYTWSKSMTDNAGYFGVDGSDQPDPLPQNAYDLMGDYGPSGTDTRHNLTGTLVYQLPFGRQKQFGANWNRLTDEALGGWELSGDAMLYTGLPVTMITFSPTGLTNSAQENDDGVERANQYTHMKIVHRSTKNWFGTDPSAVPCRDQGTETNSLGATCAYGLPGGPTLADQFGNARVGTERAPGFRQVDMSVFKAFQIHGEQNVKFRMDAFNVFNLASYGPPKNNISSSSFGSIKNTLSPPRQIQFSAVYQF